MNVTEHQALLLPRCVPGFKWIDVKLLPSSLTKCKLWKMYHDESTAAGHVAVGYSIQILRPVEAALSVYCDHETSFRSLLDLPKEQ